MLLPLAQLAVNDAYRHHSTVIPDHGGRWGNARIIEHTGLDQRRQVPVGQSQHNVSQFSLTAVRRVAGDALVIKLILNKLSQLLLIL